MVSKTNTINLKNSYFHWDTFILLCLFFYMRLTWTQILTKIQLVSLTEMLVFCEEVVEDPKSGLEIQVDDILGPCLGLRQTPIHHQLKGQTNVGNFFVKRLKWKMNRMVANSCTKSQVIFGKKGIHNVQNFNVKIQSWIMTLTGELSRNIS